MKKIILLICLVFILVSCEDNKVIDNEVKVKIDENIEIENNEKLKIEEITSDKKEVKIIEKENTDIAKNNNKKKTIVFDNYTNSNLGISFNFPVNDFKAISPESYKLNTVFEVKDGIIQEETDIVGGQIRLEKKEGKRILFPQFSIHLSEKKYSEYKTNGDLSIVKEEYSINGKNVKKIIYPALIYSYDIIVESIRYKRTITLSYDENVIGIYGGDFDQIIDSFIDSLSFHDTKIIDNNKYLIIKNYYDNISKKEYEKAYYIKYEPGYSLDEFKKIYSDVDKISISPYYRMEFISNNDYKFYVFLKLDSGKYENYLVQMKITDGKIKTIKSEKVN